MVVWSATSGRCSARSSTISNSMRNHSRAMTGQPLMEDVSRSKPPFRTRLRSEQWPRFYISLKLFKDGSFEEVYNGPGRYIADHYFGRKGIVRR